MANYYILSIDSYINALSVIDATKELKLSLESQKKEEILAVLQEGDKILVYRKKPLGIVNMFLEVIATSSKGKIFRKQIEVCNGTEISNESFSLDIEQKELTQIRENDFNFLLKKMITLDVDNPEIVNEESMKPRITGAENILLYGVPGVGKSHTIQEDYCDDENRIERVVFHPDYTYSDFVGQILPRVENGQLKYVFTSGPFTKMLEKSWKRPDEKFYLIIEEINRGNAPAIFGEIFQLLDRKEAESHKYSETEIGESEYGITNYDVASVVYGEEEHSVRIPSNMWILATMNTADQNVFTLDTAFQRRWNMQHIKNDVMSAEHAQIKIEGTDVEWGAFATVINDMVVEFSVNMASSEDKRLGAYFVKQNELTAKRFPEKALKYLWDDAFKMDKESIFDEKFKSLEDVIETYEKTDEDRLKSVLRLDVYKKMVEKMKSSDEENE